MSDPIRKKMVARRFGSAVETYDAFARIQAESAMRLAARIVAHGLPPQARILEVGCGTGHLTQPLSALSQGGLLLASDLSPAMARATRAGLAAMPGGGGVQDAHMLAMDGEHPALAMESLDLVCGNLAAQWFGDLPRAIAGLSRLLRPGGFLALTTLGAETFAAWRAAHHALGFIPRLPVYPDAAALARMIPDFMGAAMVEHYFLTERHETALDFLRGLRKIGADLPAQGTVPLSPGALRRVLRSFACVPGGGFGAVYQILTLIAVRRA